jgi:hypothetical protein
MVFIRENPRNPWIKRKVFMTEKLVNSIAGRLSLRRPLAKKPGLFEEEGA